MKSRFISLFAFLVLVNSCHHPTSRPLHIATAANMQFAMKELTQVFTQKTNIECQNIISSSGKLTAQIEGGAPFDIFVSADLKYPNELHKNGWTHQPPNVYAKGQLVIWTTQPFERSLWEVLQQSHIRHIAIANPKTAPYGKATVEVLHHLNLYSSLRDKLVYGESIAQTNQFIVSQSAEIGFTAKSVVLAPNLKNKGTWEDVPPKSYSPIEQGVVILKNARTKMNEAQQFYDFLFSEKAKTILKKYGYE